MIKYNLKFMTSVGIVTVMRRLLSVLIVIIFFVWILPLGAFIKPSQEKEICNGKRAICLCRHHLAKQTVQKAGEVLLKSGGGVNKHEGTSHSSSPKFILITMNDCIDHKTLPFITNSQLSYNRLIVQPIEHIPKG